MKLIDPSFPSSRYEDYVDQHLNLEDLSLTFAEIGVEYFTKRTPLWTELKRLLENVDPNSISGQNGVLVKGADITSLLLCEGLEYFSRAFYNFYAQDKLVEHGYLTWSQITNYYASFFCLQSLLHLQGRCITRIFRPTVLTQFYIFPYRFRDHEYVICTNRVRRVGTHEATWKIYCDVYEAFTYPEEVNFECIFKNFAPEEEMEHRNRINYEPYQGYDEIWDPQSIPEIVQEYEKRKFTHDEIETLSKLTTDPEFGYYARTTLRLILFYRILRSIAKSNLQLALLLAHRGKSMKHFLRQVKPRDKDGTISQRLPMLLNL
jgi:hypothetical protein